MTGNLLKVAGFSINALRQLPRRAAAGLIRGYQLFVSPVLPGSCRFYPTCSNYAIDAYRHHGLLRGTWLTVSRIGRCHPWGESKFDPVPGSELDTHHHNHSHSHAGHESCPPAS